MVFHTLLMTIMMLVFSISIGFNVSQNSKHNLNERGFANYNQSLVLFMPVEKKIVTDIVSSNDDSC